MNNQCVLHFDNRDPGQMYDYLESRIDVLKRRILELERENRLLRNEANLSAACMAEGS